MKRLATSLVAGLLTVGLFAAPAAADDTIVDAFVGANSGQYDILVAVVSADQDIIDALNAPVAKTVLAPDDRAFIRFARELAWKGVGDTPWWKIRSEADAVDFYVNNGLLGSDTVQNIVLGHVILGAAATSDVVFENRRDSFETANGVIKTYKPKFIKDSSKRWIKVSKADELVVDDVVVVHRISRVILPAGALG